MKQKRALFSLIAGILMAGSGFSATAAELAAVTNSRNSQSDQAAGSADTERETPPRLDNAATPVGSSSPSPSPAAKNDNGPPSLFDEDKALPAADTASLDVRVNVPKVEHPLDVFMIHPYPVCPPKIAKPQTPLPDTAKGLKDMILQSGYINRDGGVKPYTAFGKRWYYAYHEGLRKSGAGEPHGIFTMYQWEKEVMPFVRNECIKWNLIEAERKRRYEKAIAEFQAHRADYESDAVRQGLSAMEMRKRGFGWAVASIPTGSWWLTCTRKIPGLTYYWQIPLTAAAGENIKIVLSQANALVITGGW